jgi:hypothetical protein
MDKSKFSCHLGGAKFEYPLAKKQNLYNIGRFSVLSGKYHRVTA